MELSCPLGIRALSRKYTDHALVFFPCNKSFIDQACAVKMAGYWPRSVFCLFMDRDERSDFKLSLHLKNNAFQK